MNGIEDAKRVLLCAKCKQAVAVSPVAQGEPDVTGKPNPGWAHDWHCLSDVVIDEHGMPHCKCGQQMVFHPSRIRSIKEWTGN